MIKVKHLAFMPTQVVGVVSLIYFIHTFYTPLMHRIAHGCTKGVLIMTRVYKIYIFMALEFLFS